MRKNPHVYRDILCDVSYVQQAKLGLLLERNVNVDSLNSISKSPFKNFHFKLILGADRFLVLQGQPGKRGARGPMGEPGPKVHDSIIQITRFASKKNSLLPKWSPSWISFVGFILNLFEMFRQVTHQSTHKEPPFPGQSQTLGKNFAAILDVTLF